MEDLTQREMRYGDHICILIKQIYYPDTPWGDSYRLVAKKFSEFKCRMRKVYPNIKEMADVLEQVQHFSAKDVTDSFANEDGYQVSVI